jgi:hypothetical protein
MIYKNSQKWSLVKDGADELKNLKAKYPHLFDEKGNPKGAVRIKMVESYYKKVEVMSDRNGKISSGYVYPTKAQRMNYTVADEQGEMTSWYWCRKEQPYDKALGQYKIKADTVDITEGAVLNLPKDLELFWFLDTFCPIIVGSGNQKRNVKPSVYFENKIAESANKVRERKAVAEAEVAVYNMTRVDLDVLYARVFGKEVEASLTDAQVQDVIVTALKDPLSRERVIKYANDGKADIKAVIAQAIEVGLLSGDEDSTWIVKGGKKDILAQIPFTAHDMLDRLTEYLKDQKTAFNKLEKQLKVTA